VIYKMNKATIAEITVGLAIENDIDSNGNIQSRFRGTTHGIQVSLIGAARVSTSRLVGPVFSNAGTLTCVASYDGSNVVLDSRCQ